MAAQIEQGGRGHLLLVDDDSRIRTMMSRYFEGEGYTISLAADGREMRHLLSVNPDVDLLLLDLGLPDQDGLDLVREVRATSEVGIIIVTGRADDIDRIVGLELGADDYIAKPFNLRELLARVKSVLRRLQPATDAAGNHRSSAERQFRFEGWTLDRERRELTSPAGKNVPLTTGEFDLLCVFAENAGRVLSRDFLLDHTRGRTWEAFDRTIDAQVSRLRRKIEADPEHAGLIKSVRSVGYVFTGKQDPVS